MIIPKRYFQRYDGESIKLKKECREGCKFYRHIGKGECCGLGVAFKVLTEGEKLIKCKLRGNKGSGIHSLKYVDQFIEEMAEKGIFLKNCYGGVGI